MSEQSGSPIVNDESSFAAQVSGLDAKPIDMTLAHVMADLYDGGPGVDGWTPLNDGQLRDAGIDPASLKNEDSGFLSRIYGDGDGHYVLAFSGTDEGKDWLTNFRQGLGFEDAQFNQAIAAAREARVAFGDEVVITGHSLGGGLAGAASIASGIPAVTFNSSGVHDKTLERLGIDADAAKADVAENGQIRRYAVKNEILTTLQEDSIPLKWVMPDAVGHKIELPDPDPQSFWERLVPGSGIKHGVDIHYIDAVIKAQEMAMPELAAAARNPADPGGFLPDRARIDGAQTVAASMLVAGAGTPGLSQPGPIGVLPDRQQALAISDPAHPGFTMFDQTLRGLEGLDPRALDFPNAQSYRTAAATAASDASTHGMQRVDHVVASNNRDGFFLVEGGMDDPGHRRLFVDQQRALSQPIEQSAANLQQQSAQTQTEQQNTQSEQRRAMTA